jgi:hypothetical protein
MRISYAPTWLELRAMTRSRGVRSWLPAVCAGGRTVIIRCTFQALNGCFLQAKDGPDRRGNFKGRARMVVHPVLDWASGSGMRWAKNIWSDFDILTSVSKRFPHTTTEARRLVAPPILRRSCFVWTVCANNVLEHMDYKEWPKGLFGRSAYLKKC